MISGKPDTAALPGKGFAGLTLAGHARTHGGRSWICAAILLFALAGRSAAAQLPHAPHPRIPLTDKLLLGAIVAGRAGDAVSTHQFLVAGDQEASLPNWVVSRQPRMWSYSMAAAAGQIVMSRLLIRHHQLRIARTLEIVHTAFIWDTVIHNEQLLTNPDGVQQTEWQPTP